MKTLLGMFIYVILFFNNSYSQEGYDQFCIIADSVDQGGESNQYPLFGPTDTLKILVIVCKFSDDNFNQSPHTDLWPSSLNSMPSWAPSLVSQTVQSNYTDPSISGYFQDMSLNQFQVIGDVKFYQPLHEQSYYWMSSGRHIGFLTEEILNSLNSQVNYADYDNWDPNDIDGDQIKNEPDGQVDFIAICFRFANTTNLDGSKYEGIAGLTGFHSTFGTGSQLLLDGKIISSKNLLSGLGSGTFQQDVLSLDQALHVMAHEFGHYLFGTIHYETLGFHGLMDGNGTGVMSSFERIKMNWFEQIPVNTFAPDISIPDAISTGVVYRMEINSSNYFLIDNHQRISYYESSWRQYNGGPLTSPGTGILITHYSGSGDPDIETAFGRWDWKKSGGLYVYPFQTENANRITGEDKLNLRNKNTTQGNQTHADFLGSSDDFFNMGYKQIFSPWSNPSTYPDNADLCVELLQKDQYNNIHVNIYIQDAVNAPPSKPGEVTIEWYGDNPKITWETNEEPDMQSYMIWKYAAGSSMIAATVTHNPNNDTHSWIDTDVFRPGKFDPLIEYIYKVKGVDNTNKESLYSDEVSIIGTGGIWKKGIKNDDIRNDKYKLSNNYPNPFNPSTQIRYSLAQDADVTLKVYDMLGTEVAELINETQTAGSYEINFSSEGLSSGVYIYRITAANNRRILFTDSKQMLLMK